MKTLCTFAFSKSLLDYMFFVIIAISTMWVSSNLFTDTHILPQWYSFAGAALIWAIVYFIKSKASLVKVSFFTIALTIFLLYLFFNSLLGNWNISLLTIPCFFTLFFIFQTSNDDNFEIFKKIIVAIVLCQAVFGILQYANLVSNHTSFPIVGSFDNPAGYAACMVASLPFCLFSSSIRSWWGGLSIATTILILITLVLSESRAGILCAVFILIAYGYGKISSNVSRKKAIAYGAGLVLALAIVLGVAAKHSSAIGRVMIWQNTGEMFKEAPVFGHGANSFQAEYMTYQAEFFENQPDHPHADLADNVAHPFNEYLLLMAEYGIIGLLLFLAVVIILIWNVKSLSPFIVSLIGIGIFALFSYPLKYGYVLVILALCCGHIAKEMVQIKSFKISVLGRVVAVGASVVMMFFLVKDISFEYRWRRTVSESRYPMNHAMDDYAKLYEAWNGDPLFLYNYGAYLNQQKRYADSNTILFECEKYFNDYDVQSIIANNYYHLQSWSDASARYEYASRMCPNRFIPLYQLFNIYVNKGQTVKANEMAKLILAKPVKVESSIIAQIKAEISDYLNTHSND